MDNRFERVQYPEDPERCQGGGAYGQCPFRAIAPGKYCPRHGANSMQEVLKAKMRRQYDFAQWQQSIDNFSEYEGIKGLREEVGIMRMLLQNVLLLCKDEHDLLMYTGKISEVVSEVKALILAMHKLDTNLGQMLDKNTVLNIAASMVEIVLDEVVDIMIAERIGKRFAELINRTNNDVGQTNILTHQQSTA